MPVQSSVVIPTYNRAPMLRRALASIFAQTRGDFEVIVVDDASEDETQVVLENIRDSRLRCFRHDIRAGASAARNTGLQACRGDYVAFLDSDDEWLPQKLEQQLAVFERRSTCGLVYTGALYLYPDSRTHVLLPRHRGRITEQLLVSNVVGSTSVGMIRRAVLDVIGEFDAVVEALEDHDLWLRISQHFDIDFTPAILVRRHIHDDKDRISNDADRQIAAREAFVRKHRELFKAEGVEHRFHSRTAYYHLRRTGDRREAARAARRAIQAKPTSLPSYLVYAAAFMPRFVLAGVGMLRVVAQRAGIAAHDTRRTLGRFLSSSGEIS